MSILKAPFFNSVTLSRLPPHDSKTIIRQSIKQIEIRFICPSPAKNLHRIAAFHKYELTCVG